MALPPGSLAAIYQYCTVGKAFQILDYSFALLLILFIIKTQSGLTLDKYVKNWRRLIFSDRVLFFYISNKP